MINIKEGNAEKWFAPTEFTHRVRSPLLLHQSAARHEKKTFALAESVARWLGLQQRVDLRAGRPAATVHVAGCSMMRVPSKSW